MDENENATPHDGNDQSFVKRNPSSKNLQTASKPMSSKGLLKRHLKKLFSSGYDGSISKLQSIKEADESLINSKLEKSGVDKSQIGHSFTHSEDQDSGAGLSDNANNTTQLRDSQEQKYEDLIASKTPKYIIRTNSKGRLKWDLFVMLLATWNCMWIPIDIAFEPSVSSTVGFILIDKCID